MQGVRQFPGHATTASGVRLHSLPRRLCRVKFVSQDSHHEVRGAAEASSTQDPVTAWQNVSVIGMGARGISAMKRLSGAECATGIQLWAVDSDRKVLASTSGLQVSTIELQPSDDSTLAAADLQRLTGDAQPTGQELGIHHQGIAFVLGSAFGSPGGSTLMLQLVNHLRRCGFFVAVALTRPFAFEGARKLEQADALIEALEDVAAMVVVIDQNVLTRASSELTMAEASAIADNTLEYTVRSLMSALRAPELLKVTRGAFLWHGRDLRLMKHPLFPPMMHLVTCPGIGNLGRGQASMPLASLQQARLPSALSTLAEDAVKAAAESPFLENKVANCTAMLCVLLLPGCLMDLAAMEAYFPGLTDHQREFALRSAIQVAAMTVQELAGPQCTDIIVCPQVRATMDTSASLEGLAAGMLTLECAMLALQAIPEAATKDGATLPRPQAQSIAAASPGPEVAVSPMSRLGLERAAQRQRPGAGLASMGVSVTGRGSSSREAAAQPPIPSTRQQPVQEGATGATGQQVQGRAGSSGIVGTGAGQGQPRVRSKTNYAAMSLIAGGSAAGSQSTPASSRIQQEGGQAKQGLLGRNQVGVQSQMQQSPSMRQGTRPGNLLSTTAAARTVTGNTSMSPKPMREEVSRIPNSLEASLVSQSLDLPPGAARWRHLQRKAAGTPSRPSTYQLPETADAQAHEEGADHQPARPMDVRARAVGMLEKEREFH